MIEPIREQEKRWSKVAGEVLFQYRCVVLFTDNKVYTPATKTTSHFVGITIDEKTQLQLTALNLMIDYQYDGIALAEAGGAFDIGDYVTYDSLGRVVKATVIDGTDLSTAGFKPDEIIGMANEAALDAGDVVAVEIRPMFAIVSV